MPDSQLSKDNAASLVWDWRDREARRAEAEAREALGTRKRGALGFGIGVVVAASLYGFLHRPLLAGTVVAISALLAVLALVFPLTHYRRAAGTLDRFSRIVASTVTWLLMTLLYVFLFLPVGLALRSSGRLGITRHYDSKRDSYWKVPRARPSDLESYRRQF